MRLLSRKEPRNLCLVNTPKVQRQDSLASTSMSIRERVPPIRVSVGSSNIKVDADEDVSTLKAKIAFLVQLGLMPKRPSTVPELARRPKKEGTKKSARK